MKYDAELGDLLKLVDYRSSSRDLIDGLSVSEDNKGIRFEALAPHIDPKTIEVTFKKGFLTIKAKRNRKD